MPLFRCVRWIAVIYFGIAGLAMLSMSSSVSASSYDQTGGSQSTSQMQQMDYQRRAAEERRAQAERQESEIVTDAQDATAGADYALLGVVASSGLVFFVIRRRRGGSTRQRLAPRRPRFRPPSRN
ncbi:MAG: hypothetical protein WAW06_07540 [bacterium]